MKEKRKEIAESLPSATFQEIQKKLGSNWRMLDESVKKDYQTRAREYNLQNTSTG